LSPLLAEIDCVAGERPCACTRRTIIAWRPVEGLSSAELPVVVQFSAIAALRAPPCWEPSRATAADAARWGLALVPGHRFRPRFPASAPMIRPTAPRRFCPF